MRNSQLNAIYAYGALYNFFRSMVGAYSTLFLLRNGISLQELSYLKALQAVFVVLCELPLSALSDRTNRKYLAVAGVVFSALFLLLTGLHQHFWHLVAAEFANAVSVAIFSGTIDSYVADVSDDNSVSPSISLPRFNSYQFTAMAAGGICGVVLFLPQSPAPWIVAGLGSILTALAFVPFLPNTQVHTDRRVRINVLDSARLAVAQLHATATARLVAAAFIANSLFFQLLIQFWQPMAMSARDMSGPNLERLLGVLFVATLFAQAIASRIMEIFTVRGRSPVVFGYTVLAVSSLAFAVSVYWRIPVLAFVCLFLLFLGNRIAITSNKVQVLALTSNSSRAVTLSSLSLSIRLLIAVILPLFAWAISVHGWAIIMFTAGLLFIGARFASRGALGVQL